MIDAEAPHESGIKEVEAITNKNSQSNELKYHLIVDSSRKALPRHVEYKENLFLYQKRRLTYRTREFDRRSEKKNITICGKFRNRLRDETDHKSCSKNSWITESHYFENLLSGFHLLH